MTYIDNDGNITQIKGDTFNLLFYNIKGDNGRLIDFTNYSVELNIKHTPNLSSNVLQASSTSGSIDISIPGKMHISLSADTISAIPTKIYYYDLVVTDSDNITERWFNNKFFKFKD